MTVFGCPQCGMTVETLGVQAWHRCAGRIRELRPVQTTPPEPQPAPETVQGRLF